MIRCFSHAASRVAALIGGQLRELCGHLRPRRIVVKPNWVLHETDPVFPIAALVTDPRVIEATVRACLELFPGADSVLVGDCPLQYADWPRLCRQSGLEAVIQRCAAAGPPRVSFLDLRREVFELGPGGFMRPSEGAPGDPRGYGEIELGERSHLEPLADQADRFAVNDYSQAVTRSNHRRGSHRYRICQSILDADLFINLPKWKSHQKSAITGALKNLVGINADKACLPHFRRGAPRWGGDEYPDDKRWLYFWQTRLRQRFQKRSQLAYRLLKPGWELLKRLRGIQTRLTDPNASPEGFYTAGGAWPGNDTLWRMVYDLNLIIRHANAEGRLSSNPERACVCIVDGLTSGEGNGPLQPLPRQTDWLIFGEDPFGIDAALSWFMGFNPERIPLIARRAQFSGSGWGEFEVDDLTVQLDGQPVKLVDSGIDFRFAPPPGWRNHVER